PLAWKSNVCPGKGNTLWGQHNKIRGQRTIALWGSFGRCGSSWARRAPQRPAPGGLRRGQLPGRRVGKCLASRFGRLGVHRTGVEVKAVAQRQRAALVKLILFAEAKGRRHPAVVAYVPGARVTRIGGMIEPGDALPRLAVARAAVIHPA